MTDMTVAKTILEQLGGGLFARMTGATGFVGSADSLSMKVAGRIEAGDVNVVKVTLDPSDTYTVEGFYMRAGKRAERFKESGVYCDMLQDCFLRATGLYASLR
jgi:hypothetical protein